MNEKGVGLAQDTSRGEGFSYTQWSNRMLKRFIWSTGCLIFISSLVCLVATVSVAKEPSSAKNDLLFGMSTALSGPAADLGKNMRLGVLAGFERANRAGGIQGKTLRLIALDDGYEPSRTAPNMRKLIEREQVLAVIGNVGTPTAIAAIPIANQEKTLLFAPFTGAGVLRKIPPDRYIINYRASYAEEIGAMIDALITKAKLKTHEIAFFTQRDGYGDAGFVGGVTALKRHGLKNELSILHVRYERNTVAVEDALARILMADSLPRAIIMVGAYAPCAQFIQLANDSGLEALFLNVSFVGSEPLAQQLGSQVGKVIVTQVVPHPTQSTLPIIKEYNADLKALESSPQPTFGSLEGYIAARILVKALKTTQGTITREGVVVALQELGNFDAGLGHSLTLSDKQHQASHEIWPTILKKGSFIPLSWSDVPPLF